MDFVLNFPDLSQLPRQMIQAEDRVHRIGQEEMVDVISPSSLGRSEKFRWVK